jgi:quinoprotein glucose dehydrogenase
MSKPEDEPMKSALVALVFVTGMTAGCGSLDQTVEAFYGKQIRTIVTDGKGLMPPFTKLPTKEVDLIISYLADPAGASAHATANPIRANSGSTDLTAAHYKSGFGFMFANSGRSVIAPPWTTLTAYDLKSGEIRWKVPLGEVP